jgi:hypothetical protein
LYSAMISRSYWTSGNTWSGGNKSFSVLRAGELIYLSTALLHYVAWEYCGHSLIYVLARVGEASLAFLAPFPDLEQATRAASSNLQRSFLIVPLRSPEFPLEYSRKVSWE